MKCIECKNWNGEECTLTDSDPSMPPDMDIFCGEAGDIQEDYSPAEAKQ